jgi:hypothetical protein
VRLNFLVNLWCGVRRRVSWACCSTRGWCKNWNVIPPVDNWQGKPKPKHVTILSNKKILVSVDWDLHWSLISCTHKHEYTKEALTYNASASTTNFTYTALRSNYQLSELHDLESGKGKVKDKDFPLQTWAGPWGSGRLRFPDFLDFRHYKGCKVVTLTHRPSLPPRVFLVLIFRGWVDPRAHGSVGSFG